MAKITGTATNYKDLLAKLQGFTTQNGWTQLRYTVNDELILKGPKVVGIESPIVLFKIKEDSSYQGFSWEMRASTGYNLNSTFNQQPGVSPGTYLTLWNNPIKYWFYLNSRRIIVIAKTGTSYQSAYTGFFNPYALPTEYPLPLCVFGGFYKNVSYSYDNAAHRMCIDPGYGSAFYRTRAAPSWQLIYNHAKSSGKSKKPTDNIAGTWPCKTFISGASKEVTRNFGYNGLNLMTATGAGALPQFNVHIVNSNTKELVGLIDGLNWAAGEGKSSEQISTLGADKYIFFQNIFRITNSDFMTVLDK